MFRYELKYLIRSELSEAVVEFLSRYLEMDRNCRTRDNHTYSVRSIYFDSPDFECFHAKLSGQKYREKFRIRAYNQPGSGPLALEDKIKNGISYVKDKVFLDSRELEAIASLDYDSLKALNPTSRNGGILERLFFHVYRKAYSPVVLVTYDREAYVHPMQETIRVTLDRNLRTMIFPSLGQIYEEDVLEELLYNWIILEVKFSHVMPRWIKSLSTLFHLRRQACSKYCTSVAHFLGEIPNFKAGLAHVWPN
jgi:hypothetical protein